MPGVNGAACLRVLLVDDHPMIRAAVRQLLTQRTGFEVCGEAGNVDEARLMAAARLPDLILLDLRLPDGDGLTLLEEVRGWDDPPLVLILTAEDEADAQAMEAMRLGAAGFVNKRAGGEELIRVVKQVCAGRTYLNDGMIGRLLRRTR